MAVDTTARGLAAKALPKAGGTLTGPITGTSNVVEQRNGTSAQKYSVFNTYTDASNYERVAIQFATNVAYVNTESAGTGTLRGLVLGGATVSLGFGGGPTTAWTVNASGHFMAGADATYDIGASGATRPHNLYISGYIAAQAPNTQSGTTYTVAATDYALIFTAATTCTVTLPTASSFTGRQLRLKGTGGATVVSNASNVVPRAGGAAGTAILAAAAGSWAELISDGTNWIIMAGA